MFLLSLLGETTCTQGSFVVPNVSIAYAAQEPLIIAASLRENILFGHGYSPKWYSSVVEACALKSEIERMEGQDEMLLTEKGTNLSGGQRQHIVRCPNSSFKGPFEINFSVAGACHIFQSDLDSARRHL